MTDYCEKKQFSLVNLIFTPVYSSMKNEILA
jgi:hypothetical protein